jgi:formylglycine-generating enzyme required for sulfatase activity
MTKHLAALLLALLLVPAVHGQPKKPDAKRIARLEKKLAAAEKALTKELTALRSVFRSLKERLESPSPQDRARMEGELARVLEGVLNKARRMGGGSRSKRKKLAEHYKKAVPPALQNLEDESLKLLSGYIQKRLLEVIKEGSSIDDSLALSHEQWAQRALQNLLDSDQKFYERWNQVIYDLLPETKQYVKAYKAHKSVKEELLVARDPMVQYQIGVPKGFARVPAGSFVMNNTAGFGGEGIRKGNKRFTLAKPVLIGLREVTNREYQVWLLTLTNADEIKRHLPKDPAGKKVLWTQDPATKSWGPDEERLDHPVVGVRLASAIAYAASRGARLPTEQEWCACASGFKGFNYPWGDQWADGLCNSKEAALSDTVAVESFADGRGPFGHFDMSGNVMEWTLTYESGKRIEPEKVDDAHAVIRGGSFKHTKKDVVTGWVWYRRAQFDQDDNLGFRLAMDDPQAK